MKLIDNQLISLICLGLQTKDITSIPSELFLTTTRDDWQAIRKMADKQGVSVIVFDGLNQWVVSRGKDEMPSSVNPQWWELFVHDWMGVMVKTEMRNKRQMMIIDELASKWTSSGCRVMVFKGQACASLYPTPEHRNPGDIDCYLFDHFLKGNKVARECGALVDDSWYKHSVINYRSESFENHQYFVHTREGKRSKQLEKELEEALCYADFTALTENVQRPPVQWNAMFLTYHAFSHFISEGLRLKQLLDWAMFLNNHQKDVDWKLFYSFCSRYHLRRFADAITSICVEFLGVVITNPAITFSSPYSNKILKSALYDDDYVFGSGKGEWHNRWHLVRNLFHYRWKYVKIYQESLWKQLWWYAIGYLFKTE